MKHVSILLSMALAVWLLPASGRADDSNTHSRSGRTAGDRYDDDDRDGDRDRDHDDDDRYDDDRYDDHRRGGYVDPRVVRDLAHDLESLTRAAYREAARSDDRYRYRGRYDRDSRAIADLDRLHDRARQFRREVDRSGRDRRSSEREFDALYGAYVDAAKGWRTMRQDRELRDLLPRVDHTMDELVDYYGGESRYAHWRNGRDDRDRDRDDDGDLDRDDDGSRDRHRSSDSRYENGRDDDDRDDDDDDDDEEDDDDDRDHEAHRRSVDDDRR